MASGTHGKHLNAVHSEVHGTGHIDTAGYHFFLKGDISGIQDFIFSVKSKRASRTLKGRSYFIHALSEICLQLLKSNLPKDSFLLFYNGGGNFYVLLKKEFKAEITSIQAAINEDCKDQEYHVTLSVSPFVDFKNDFANAWKGIQAASNKGKLRKYHNFIDGFAPYVRNIITEPVSPTISPNTRDPFEKLARELIKAEKWQVTKLETKANIYIGDKGVVLFNHRLELGGDNGNDFKNIIDKLPTWDKEQLNKRKNEIKEVKKRNENNSDWEEPRIGGIIDFEYLAEFAKTRTGSRKLGVLKMDVDNLGKLFEGIQDGTVAEKLSGKLSNFFGDSLKKLLEEDFTYIAPCKPTEKPSPDNADQFFHNIYVVFSGGDDCFFIGGWDAILEFATRIQSRFEAFAKATKDAMPTLVKDLTISAGIVMVGPKFPVSRFALLAEEGLKNAKQNPGKNAVHLFGHTLTWETFRSARQTAGQIARIILQRGENRAILERLQRESEVFEHIVKNTAEKGIIQGRSVWRLLYSVSRTAKEANKQVLTDITKKFSNSIVDTLMGDKAKAASMLYEVPVAARWAEFLTRNNNSTNKNVEDEPKQS